MAMVNVRIEDELKARVDAVLQRRNITATQNMIELYRYIDQHEQSPFIPAPRPHTVGDVAAKCCSDLLNIRDALLLIRSHAERQASVDELIPLYQMLTRSRLALADDLCWLHSAPALPSTVNRLLQPFAQAQTLIADCDVTLGGGSRDSLSISGDALLTLTASVNALNEVVLNLCQKVGIVRRLPPVAPEEQHFEGEFCTVLTTAGSIPGDVCITILLRPDLLRLLTPHLKEALRCPKIPGWTPYIGMKNGYNTVIPVQDYIPKTASDAVVMACSGTREGCSLLFVEGETQIHCWPDVFSDTPALPPDRLAEAVCGEIDKYIQMTLQGIKTGKQE
ncbi:hypothetical protein ACSZM7_10530 [Aeromonas veronii]